MPGQTPLPDFQQFTRLGVDDATAVEQVALLAVVAQVVGGVVAAALAANPCVMPFPPVPFDGAPIPQGGH